MWKLLRILGKFPDRMISAKEMCLWKFLRDYCKVSSLQDKNTWPRPQRQQWRIWFSLHLKRILKAFYFFLKGILRRYIYIYLFQSSFDRSLNSWWLNPWGHRSPLEKCHNHKLPCLFKGPLYTQCWCQGKYKKKQGGLYHQVSYSLINKTWLPHIKW